MTAAERLAERLAAAARPHVPRGERQGPSASREIACRSCGRWTVYGDTGPWRHVDDGSLACVDPATLLPYAHAFTPEGCEGRVGNTNPGRAACSCGWRDAVESPDRPTAYARWVGHTASVPSRGEQLAGRMAEDDRHADHGGEGS